jgi:hypothetical protein
VELLPRQPRTMSGTRRYPVATPNYIASPRRGDAGRMSFGMEETLAHGCSNDFAAGLAGAVGIVSSQHIRFPITPGPVQVIVDLVAGHDHHCSCLGTMANDVEQGCNSDDVGGERLDRSDIERRTSACAAI